MEMDSGGSGWTCLIVCVALVLVVAFIAIAATAGNHNVAVVGGHDNAVTQSITVGSGGSFADTLAAVGWAFLIAVVGIISVIGFVAMLIGNGGRR